jgi:hypothetical protein
MDTADFEGKGQHQPLGGPAGSVAGSGGGGGGSSKNALHHSPFGGKQVRVLGDDDEADDDQNISAGGGMGNLVAKAFTALKRSFSGDAQDAMEPSSSCDAVGKKGYGTDPSSELEQDMQSVMQNAAMAVLHTTKACKDPPPHLHAPELYHPEQVTSYAEMPYWGKANKDNNAHEGAKNLDVGGLMKSMIEATEAMKSDPGDFATAEEFYQQQQQHHEESNNANDEGEGGVVGEEQHFQQEFLPSNAVVEEGEKEKDAVFQMPRKNSLDNDAMIGGGSVGEEGEMNNTLLREVEVEVEEHDGVVDDARAMEQAAEELAAKEEEALERLEEAVMMFSSD